MWSYRAGAVQGPRVGQAAVRGPESHPKQALLLGLQRQEGEVASAAMVPQGHACCLLAVGHLAP